jgi:hypothetical protein
MSVVERSGGIHLAPRLGGSTVRCSNEIGRRSRVCKVLRAFEILSACGVLAVTRPVQAQFWKWNNAPCDRTWSDGKLGRQPPETCSVSLTLSPYHAAYPIAFVSTEWRVGRRLGVAADTAIGAFHSGTVGQLGLRAPFYATGSFDGGLQIGPFVRATSFYFSHASAVESPNDSPGHRVGAPSYNDVEFARANGRNALFGGVLIGGKFVVGGRDMTFTWVRGFTIQAGFLIGYHHLAGAHGYAPDPLAAHTRDGFLSQLYADVGWSF